MGAAIGLAKAPRTRGPKTAAGSDGIAVLLQRRDAKNAPAGSTRRHATAIEAKLCRAIIILEKLAETIVEGRSIDDTTELAAVRSALSSALLDVDRLHRDAASTAEAV